MYPFLIFTFKNNIRFAKLSLAFIWKNPFTGVPLLTCSSRHASTTSAACGARLTCPKMPEFITTLMTTIQSQWQLDGARSTESSDKRRDSFKDFGTWDKVLRRGHLQDIQIKVNKVFYDELFILKPPRPDTVKILKFLTVRPIGKFISRSWCVIWVTRQSYTTANLLQAYFSRYNIVFVGPSN